MSWTEEKVNKLKELWGKGNTASLIAENLKHIPIIPIKILPDRTSFACTLNI